jgi:hypothetical protein
MPEFVVAIGARAGAASSNKYSIQFSETIFKEKAQKNKRVLRNRNLEHR